MPPARPFRITSGMLLRMLADTIMLQMALMAALALRLFIMVLFENAESVPQMGDQLRDYLSLYFQSAWPLTSICLVVFFLNGFYTYGHFYQGRYKALMVIQAVSLGYLLYTAMVYFVGSTLVLPRSVLAVSWLISLAALLGARMWVQIWDAVMHRESTLRPFRSGGKRKVLVIGGAGYIGSALVPKLLERGYDVRILDLLLFGEDPIAPFSRNSRVELVRGDFRHVENVVQAMRDVDAVVHLGAIVGDPACSLDEALTIDVNLSATRMIAQLAKSAGVERFVFASTCSVYGACDEMLDERSEVRPISLYGHTKLASEKVLRQLTDATFSPTIVRFSTIYGLSGRTRFDLVVNVLAAKAKIDGEITIHGGDQWRPFVHVDDAANAVAMILDAPIELVGGETFNVGSNEQNYTIHEIGELVHQQVVSARITADNGGADKRNYRVDFTKIRNVMGFKPQWTVEMGIRQVLEAIASGDVVDYQQSQYSNFKFLTETGTAELAGDRWARELIRDLRDS